MDEFTKKHDNPLEDCVEVMLHPVVDAEDNSILHVHADLRCGLDEVTVDDTTFQVGVAEGAIQVQLENCDTIPGSRFNEKPREGYVREVEVHDGHQDLDSRAGFGKLNLDLFKGFSFGLSAGAERKKSRTTTKTARTKYSEEIDPVTPRGGGKYHIKDPVNNYLDKAYLANTKLLEVKIDQRRNYFDVSASFLTRQRELYINPVASNNLVSRESYNINKKKIIGILIGKSLSHNKPGDGQESPASLLILARSRISR